MARFASHDLALANPPEPLPESARCTCGHALEDHATGWLMPCEANFPQIDEPCECADFLWEGE